MNAVSIIPIYFAWHYGRAFGDLFRLWRNLLWFAFHFFSIGSSARTLFSPWRRLGENRSKGFNPGVFFESLIVNTIMRIVGAVMRLSTIFIGLVFWVIIFLLGIIAVFAWIILPALIVVIFLSGIKIIF